jgi:hypothetical protein
MLRSYLWSKYGGEASLMMVLWDVCNFVSYPRMREGLGLIDLAN